MARPQPGDLDRLSTRALPTSPADMDAAVLGTQLGEVAPALGVMCCCAHAGGGDQTEEALAPVSRVSIWQEREGCGVAEWPASSRAYSGLRSRVGCWLPTRASGLVPKVTDSLFW